MNTYHDLPTVLLNATSQSNPLQAIKRIAGNCGTLFTQLSRIEKEDQLDDFISYVSKQIQKPSQNTIPKESKNGAACAGDHVVQKHPVENKTSGRKRCRVFEDDCKEASENKVAGNFPRSETEDQEGPVHVNTSLRKNKRRKGLSGGPDREVDASVGGAYNPVVPASTIRASSLRTPTNVRIHGIMRSASYADTPSTSSTTLTPIPNFDYMVVQTKQAEREASFEFATPAFTTAIPPIQNLVSSVAKSMKNLSPFTAAPTIDRDKPYGSLENPHIIPSTPRAVRTVKLEVEDEAQNNPLSSITHEDESRAPKTRNSKRRQSTLPRTITPGHVRSNNAFGDPTPLSAVNQGIPKLCNSRLDQSFSMSPTFTEVMRQDDRIFRRNQPTTVGNATRNPLVQAEVASMQLNDHNLDILHTRNSEEHEDTRTKRPRNEMLSRRPQKYISPFLPQQVVDDKWRKNAHRLSSGGESKQKE